MILVEQIFLSYLKRFVNRCARGPMSNFVIVVLERVQKVASLLGKHMRVTRSTGHTHQIRREMTQRATNVRRHPSVVGGEFCVIDH
jgi:hypothetical protein